MKTNILILASGQPKSSNNESIFPLCLSELEGISLLERIVTNTKKIPDRNYTFALPKNEIEVFHLDNIINIIAPGAKIIGTQESTLGSACTALLAASQLDQNAELLIISANELVDLCLSEVLTYFRKQELDGGTITFHSINPRYSYVRLNELNQVIETSQQNPISNHATTGIFWFSKTQEFVEAAKNTIRKNTKVSGKFYVALTFNELILKQSRIGIFEINNKKYHPLKTERQVNQFELGSAV